MEPKGGKSERTGSGTYRRYWAALHRRDVAQAQDIVNQWLHERTPQQIYMRLFLPALNLSGVKWAAGEIDHRDEHFITYNTLRFMRIVRHKMVVENPTGPLAIAAGVAQESHRIGLRMCCDFIQSDNWRIVWLRGTERALLREAITEHKPDMLMFSIGMQEGIEPTRRLIQEARRCGFNGTVAVGGRAILENRANVAAMGANLTADNALQFQRKVRAGFRNNPSS
jgi:methanogenic corrinoid protein MtbC1